MGADIRLPRRLVRAAARPVPSSGRLLRRRAMAPVAIRRYLMLTVRRFTRDGERQGEMENALAQWRQRVRGTANRAATKTTTAPQTPASKPSRPTSMFTALEDGRKVVHPPVHVLRDDETGDDEHAGDKLPA